MPKETANNDLARLGVRRRVVEDADVMRLSRADQIRFAEALINPSRPNARLARAAQRHTVLIQPE